ncbi:MAG TPA: glycosyltransferase family 39 protein, partial [Anaerolineales bacterium]
MTTLSLPRSRLWLPALLLLMLLGATLRLIDLTDAPLDFHPSRQLRNFLVARDIYYHLLPDADPQTLELTGSFRRSVGQYEPPVMESLVALTYRLTGGESVAVPRIWDTLFWLLAGLALFDLARREFSPWAAMAALAFYLVLPFSVQASRSFQPDPLMTAAFMGGIYFLYRWSESQGWKWAILAALFLGFAVLVKIVIVFVVIGAAAALVLFTLGMGFWKSKQVWVMAAIMALPAFLYYVLLHPGRSSEYFLSWSAAMAGLLTSPEFYSRWLAFLGDLFGLALLFASLAGVFLAPPRLRWLLIGMWTGYLLYGLTLPFQMYTHSYY